MVNVTGTDPAIAAAVDAAIAAGGAQTAGSAQDRQAWAQTSPTNFPSGGSGVGVNPALLDAALAAGQLAYNNARLRELEIPSMRLLDEREKERLRQEAFKNAYTKAYQQAQTTGYVQPEEGGGLSARATAAYNQLPPEQKTPQAAAAIWQELVPGLSDQEAAAMKDRTSTYYARTGSAMPDEVISQTVTTLTGGRVTAGQTPTLDREKMQNDTTLGLLELQSQLRGPGDWAKYMQLTQSISPEMRAMVNQTAGRFQQGQTAAYGGMAPASVSGMIGDVGGAVSGQAGGVGGGAAVTNQGTPGPIQTAQPVASMPLGTEARAPAAVPMVAGANGVASHAIPENQAMNDAIRRAAAPMVAQNGVATHQAPVYSAAVQPGGQPVVPPVAPARFLTGNQLPRSFLGAGQDAQDFVLGNAEAAGESRRQILHEFSASLPAYQGSRRGRVKV